MRKLLLNKYGGSDALSMVQEPDPVAANGTIVVQVHAAGVNPFDWKIKDGILKDFIPLTLPVTIGGDFSGVVTQIGTDVHDFQVGDAVFGDINYLSTGAGSFAETVVANPATTVLKPDVLSFEQAAALPLPAQSAVLALNENIHLIRGQKILIHGGAGGIGSMAVQLAKHIGAYVAVTVSTDDVEYVRGLGADLIIDYKSQKFEDQISGYDAVFDTVGGDTTDRSVAVLKKGGILVSMLQKAKDDLVQKQGIISIAQNTHSTKKLLEMVREYAQAGVFKVNIEKTFTLEQGGMALDYLRDTPPKGKVVITMSSD